MEYVIHLLVLLGIFGSAAKALDLAAGQSGLLPLSQAATFGMGAYIGGITARVVSSELFIVLCAAGLAGSLLGGALAPSLRRVKGDDFALLTFAVQVFLVEFALNMQGLTGGAQGFSVPTLTIGGAPLRSSGAYALATWSTALVVFLAVERISMTPLGRLLRAARENPRAALVFRKDPFAAQMLAFVISSGLLAVCGGLFGGYLSYVNPSDFTTMASIMMLGMVILGGADSRYGAFIGAAMFVFTPEALKMAGFSSVIAGHLQQILFGIAILVVLLVKSGRSGPLVTLGPE